MSDYLFPATRKRRAPAGGSSSVTIEVGRRSAWLRGYGLSAVLDEIDSPRMWCPRQKCLTCPVDRVSDLLDVVEIRENRRVELVAVDR
jgi:hypothetical protein